MDELTRLGGGKEAIEMAKIRLATSEDARDIARIQHESWLETYPNEAEGITREDLLGYLKSVDARTERWEARLQNSDPTLRRTVITEGEHVIGFCCVTKGANIGHIDALYLDQQYVGKGIGGMALAESLEWLGDKKPIELEVASYNVRAMSLYKKYGFRDHGSIKMLDLQNGKHIPLTIMVRDTVEK